MTVANAWVDRVGFRAAAGGTGSFGIGGGVTGYNLPAAATNPALVDGQTYEYIAEIADHSQWEIGHTVPSGSGSVFSRVPSSSSNGASLVDFTSIPTVTLSTLLATTAATFSGGGGGGTPGGSSGQVQYNNAGAFAGVTVGGDATLNTGTGALTVTKTSGVAFAPSATIDTTNAANITGGTLPAARLPATAVTPATYGDSTHVSQFTVGADGRLTAASNVVITGGAASLTVGSSSIASGTTNRLLFDNAGTLGEAVVGTGLSLSAGTLTASGGGGGAAITEFATVAALVAGSPGNVPVVQVYGYADAGDAGEASTMFAQVARAAYNTVTSADGRFWAYVPNADGINPLWFGVKRGEGTVNSLPWWGRFIPSIKLYGRSGNQGYPTDPNANDYGGFTGYIVGTALTTTAPPSPTLIPGQTIRQNSPTTNNVLEGTVIVSGSGTSWVVNLSQTVASSGTPQQFDRDPLPIQIGLSLVSYGSFTNAVMVTWLVWDGSTYVATPHKLKPNDGIVLHALAGSLPPGVNEDQVYFILQDEKFTPTTFTFTTINNFTSGNQIYPGFVFGPGSPVTSSGSITGIYTAFPSGREFIKVKVPPGVYHPSTQGQSLPIMADCLNTVWDVSGAVFNVTTIGTGSASATLAPTFAFSVFAAIQSAYAGSSTVTTTTAADAGKFYPGQWILINGLDRQDAFQQQSSIPANVGFFEFVQIATVNASTGLITFTFGQRLTQNYLSTWPNMLSGPGFIPVGPACIYGMPEGWDGYIKVEGGTAASYYQTAGSGRSIYVKDFIFNGQGITPSGTMNYIIENVTQLNFGVEVDKIIWRLVFRRCTMFGIVAESISSTRFFVIEDQSQIGKLTGGGRLTKIHNSTINDWDLGGLYGTIEDLEITGSTIINIQVGALFDDPGGAFAYTNLPNLWINEGGSPFKGAIKTSIVALPSGGPTTWIGPGAKVYFNPLDPASSAHNMGTPWVIYDVYQENVSQTTITTSNGSPTLGGGVFGTNITLVAANEPVKITSTGVVDTAISTATGGNNLVYVSATGLTTTACQVSVYPGGPSITMNGDGSGTQSAWVGRFCATTSLTAWVSAGVLGLSVATTVTMSGTTLTGIGSGTAHVFADTPVTFVVLPGNAGKLDTALTLGTIYYVLETSLNSGNCQISTSVGGSPITFNGNGVATQTAVTNPLHMQPHRAPKVTVTNSSGSPEILDMLGAVKEPLFSRAHRAFAGFYDTPLFYDSPELWGFLTSMTVNVKRADTNGPSTLVIHGPGFSGLLNAGFSQFIDMTSSGLRTISSGSPVGSTGSDLITAYTGWLGGVIGMYPGGVQTTVTFATNVVTNLGTNVSGVATNAQIIFASTLTVDSAINRGVRYFVLAGAGATSCSVSLRPGGPAVTFAGDGTGTQKAVVLGNPNNSGNFNQKPIVEVYAYTDQDITKDDIWEYIGATASTNTVTLFDSSGLGGQ